MTQAEDQTLTPDSVVSAFEVASTGKIHRYQPRAWGDGIACADRFVLGSFLNTQASNVDCLKCRSTLGLSGE
jgi:hypothetical protein